MHVSERFGSQIQTIATLLPQESLNTNNPLKAILLKSNTLAIQDFSSDFPKQPLLKAVFNVVDTMIRQYFQLNYSLKSPKLEDNYSKLNL